MPMNSEPFGSSVTVRKILFSMAFAVGFLAVGWSIYWYVASRLAASELRATLARETHDGRTWSCENLQSGGYPFSIDIECDRLTVRAQTGGGELVAHARSATVRAPLYTPKRVSIDVSSPGDVTGADAVRIDLSWRALQISTRGLPDRLDRLSVSGADAVLQTNVNSEPVRVGAFQTNFRRAFAPADAPLNYEVSFVGVESRLLDSLIGGDGSTLFAAVGSLSQIDKATTGALAERMEQWRAAGGRLTLTQVSLIKGVFAAQAEGALGLDQGRRIDGKIDLRLQNAGAPLANLAQRMGVGALPLAALAGSLFGGANGETRFAISFENGRLGIGPLKGIASLPPLY
jgi:hypothetical protein